MKTCRQIKQQYIDFYLNGGLPLFKNGEPNRGSSNRCAFWNGFNGLKNVTHAGMEKAAFDAGAHCRKLNGET